jgi:translation initiation factor 3 subunit C
LNKLNDRIKVMNEPLPSTYTKALVSLEDFYTSAAAKEKTAEKKMKAPNVRAMNTMKQKIKKIAKENEETMARYKKDPQAFEADFAAANAPAVPSAAAQAARSARRAELKANGAAPAAGEEDDDDFQTVGRGGKAVTYTSEGLFKSLAAVMEARGRKSTDRNEQVEILGKLLEVAVSTYQKIRVLLALVAARFDYNQSASAYMNAEMWQRAKKEIDLLIKTLDEDRSYVVQEITEDYDDEIDRLPLQNGEKEVVQVRGSLISFIERLDDEFTKSLQNIDPHTTEYMDRLRDEKMLYQTIIQGQIYFDAVSQVDAQSRIIMRRIEHIYAKQDTLIQALEAASSSSSASENPSALIRSLCVKLYSTPGLATERLRTRAMLCHVYHHALHRDYHIARDMFLMSHLQDSIGMADAATQILYNRAVVQIGLCAFRVGLIKESQGALQEIFASTRVKELLAQGVSRTNPYSNVSPEQEKLDRQRQLPFHMHINLELLESVYLVGSMLLEIPNIAYAGNDPDLKRNVISRNFRKMLDFTDRQVFSGPAESTRDHIMSASKALQNGDWKESLKLITGIKIWNLMVGSEEVIAMLGTKIQEEGLKTYLFTYSNYYKSLSLKHLAENFELPLSKVKSLISLMIWNEELQASLDFRGSGGEDGFVILHRLELNKVQLLVQQMAGRANYLLEQNEGSLVAKLGYNKVGGDRPERGERGEREGGRREARRIGASGRGGGRGRGRTQFNALPGQQNIYSVPLRIVTVDWKTPGGSPCFGQRTRYLEGPKVDQQENVSNAAASTPLLLTAPAEETPRVPFEWDIDLLEGMDFSVSTLLGDAVKLTPQCLSWVASTGKKHTRSFFSRLRS